jgi:NADH:ubiquinone oxidoreductase subunit 3 (subunit A)
MRAATYTPNFFAPWNVTVRTPALRYARNVALFVLAPFIGLAYALAFPFVGLGMLAWMALEK